MPEATPSLQTVCFGVFQLDLRAGELCKQGLKVKLQESPFQILALLLGNPGQVVTREELRQRLWAADTFVDFDRSVNRAINKLREMLGDSAESPRFVETLPPQGYRFVGQVESARVVRPSPLTEEHPAPAEPEMRLVPDRPPADSAPVGQLSTTPHPVRERELACSRCSFCSGCHRSVQDALSLQFYRSAGTPGHLDRISELKPFLINAGLYTKVETLQQMLVKDVESALFLLWGGAVFVLLIGGLNIANLALARWSVRGKEIAVRQALGASRARRAQK